MQVGAWVMLEGDVDWNTVGEGSQGWNGWGWLGHFPVMHVDKEGGHFHDVGHVVATVGIGPGIDKGNGIVGEGMIGHRLI